jgi:hypothetical protein
VAANVLLDTWRKLHENRVDARGIFGLSIAADEAAVATYFHAWRRRQANRQAAEWLEERTEAGLAVAEVPEEIREDVRRAVDTLLEGADGEVEPALNRLWDLLDGRPDLRERFARLRVVADAIDFLKR